MGKYGYNHGDFSWNELAVENPQRALAFYTELLGWKVEEMPMPDGAYHVLINGEEKVGGITKKQSQAADTPSNWMPYVTVDAVDESAEKVLQLGGKVLTPPCNIPVENGPRLAIVQDPEGTVFGIITYPTNPC